MPTYTYQCDNCGVRFDRQQSFSDKPLTKCPECSKRALKKVFSPPGIIFQGSGWYKTDSRSSSNGRSSSKGKASANETGESSKAETKPEAKPESKPEKAAKPASDD